MTGTAASVIALVLLLIIGVTLETSARRRKDPASVAEILGAAMRTTPGRVTVLIGWAWLGVHFLAR